MRAQHTRNVLFAALIATAWPSFGFAQAGPSNSANGVSKTEIVIGTIQDISGPIAAFGKQARNGMQQRVDEINEAGGIHGRKLRLVVEDSGYDPKKGLLAAQKMIGKDKIFAMVGTLGTPIALAGMPELMKANVPHLFPLTAAREMYEPLHPLKYAFGPLYFDQARAGVQYMAKTKPFKKLCTFYQDDDFGAEVRRGAEAGAKDLNIAIAEHTSYKRGATDFSSQAAKLKSTGCDLVVIGSIIRETIGIMGEARKIGFTTDFIGTSANYTDLIHKLGPKFTDGLYSMMTVQHPYLDDASKNVREWGNSYKQKFGEDPGATSVYGWAGVNLFARAAEKAGPNLTVKSLINALDALDEPRDMFGSSRMTFTKTKHIGNTQSRLSQIQNGKWIAISDYLTD